MTYSRRFNHDALTGDVLRRLATTPAAEVCKTGFYIHDVEEWMDSNPLNANLHFVAIATFERPSDGKRVFKMKSYDSGGTYLFYLDGDLPCPDQCVPPENPARGLYNTFSKADLMSVRAFNGITILNVHSALSFSNTTPDETHSIYAVSGNVSNPVAHTGPNDPIFTSIDYQG